MTLIIITMTIIKIVIATLLSLVDDSDDKC